MLLHQRLLAIALALAACFGIAALLVVYPSPAPSPGVDAGTREQYNAESSVAGVFEGTTPCDRVVRPLPQINTDCELAVWRLAFGPGANYALTAEYGMTEQNTPNVGPGGARIAMQGTWLEAAPAIIRLVTDDPQVSVSFLRVGDDILHLLDANERMMVGNGGWSYMLNRTDPHAASTSPILTGVFPESSAAPTGVFEGRTSCRDSLRRFTADLVPGCSRLKWRLTFYTDPATGEPTRYVSGVVGREDAQAGAWRTVRGLPASPDAVVYQLIPDGGGPALSLLKLGDSHLLFLNDELELLVGDRLWSYTLSRVGR